MSDVGRMANAEYQRRYRERQRELKHHGLDLEDRVRACEEAIVQLQAIGRPVVVEYPGEFESDERFRRPQAPMTISCEDYVSHAREFEHQNLSGIGWKCMACERKRAAADPVSLREKVERAYTEAENRAAWGDR